MKMWIAHTPSFAWSYDFLMVSIDIPMNNYVECWAQTFKTLDVRKFEKNVPQKSCVSSKNPICLNETVIRPTSKSD